MTKDLSTTSETNQAAEKPARQRFMRDLKARDLINVAIFAVIYLVVVYALNMLGFINPLVMIIALLACVIISSIPYLLFLTRAKRPGMVTLFGVVFGLLSGISGLGWISASITIAVSLIAEAILWSGNYRSHRATIWASAVFALWYIGPMMPILIDREAYLRSPEFAATGDEYISAFDELVTVPMVWGYNGAVVICGVLGALLGAAILKKHFVRAGLA